jgi:hypothetical protein
VISLLLTTLMAGCLVVARRMSLLSANSQGSHRRYACERAVNVAKAAARVRSAFRHTYESWSAAADVNGADVSATCWLSFARLELPVAGLPICCFVTSGNPNSTVCASAAPTLRAESARLELNVRTPCFVR